MLVHGLVAEVLPFLARCPPTALKCLKPVSAILRWVQKRGGVKMGGISAVSLWEYWRAESRLRAHAWEKRASLERPLAGVICIMAGAVAHLAGAVL